MILTDPAVDRRLILCAVIQVAAKTVDPVRAMRAAEIEFLEVVMRSGSEGEFGVTLFLAPPPTAYRIADYRPTLHHGLVVADVEVWSTEEAFEAWGWSLAKAEDFDALDDRMARVVAYENENDGSGDGGDA